MTKTIEEKFGKSVGDMDDGEWRIAVVDLFSGVTDRLDMMNGTIKQVPKHTQKIAQMWIIGSIYGTMIGGALLWIILSYLNHCGVP